MNFLKNICIVTTILLSTIWGESEVQLVQTKYGPFLIQSNDLCLSGNLRRTGTHNEDVLDTIDKIVRPGDNVVHLGGHIGFNDIPIMNKIGSTGALHVFEANPETYAIMVANFRLHNLFKDNNLFVYDKGVFSENKDNVDLYFNDENTSAASLNPAPWCNRKKITTQLVKLDDFLGVDCKPVDFLFMDIEGVELQALEGMQKILEKSPECIILMEWANAHLVRSGANLEKFIEDQKRLEKQLFLLHWDQIRRVTMFVPVDERFLLQHQDSDLLILPKTKSVPITLLY